MIDTERRLREGLREIADRGEAGSLTHGADRVLQGHRSWQLRRARVIGVIAAVLVIVVAVPLGLNVLWDGEGTDRSASPGEAPGILDVPTRGSLADDQAFLADFSAEWLAGDRAPGETAPAYPHIVFAGDVDAGRWLAVVDDVGGQLYVSWYTGSVGASASELTRERSQELSDEREPLRRLADDDPTGTLLVVAAPGDQIQVSPRADVTMDGEVVRSYESVETVEGVAITQVSSGRNGTSASIRVLRDGAPVYRAIADPQAYPGPAVLFDDTDPPFGGPVRPAAGSPESLGAIVAAQTVLQPIGLDTSSADFGYLWAAQVPSGSPPVLSVHVVAVRAPGGGAFVSTAISASSPDGDTTSAGVCLAQAVAGGIELDELVVVALCPANEDGAETLIVTGPTDTVRAEVLDGAGSVIADIALSGGGAIIALPDGAEAVRTYDALGTPGPEQDILRPPLGDPLPLLGDYGEGLVN
jgi:hypothetical protein